VLLLIVKKNESKPLEYGGTPIFPQLSQ